jgi:hypothetical protein
MGSNGWRAATTLGLTVGAAGIGILWSTGKIDFPIYPPPGMLVLLAGALCVALLRVSWAPAIGTALGMFMVVGFFGSGGLDDITGASGTGVAVGLIVQMTGILVALVSSVMALRTRPRRHAVPA